MLEKYAERKILQGETFAWIEILLSDKAKSHGTREFIDHK